MSMQLNFETSGERGDVCSSAVSIGSITDSRDTSGKSMTSAMKRGASSFQTSFLKEQQFVIAATSETAVVLIFIF